MEPLLSSFSSEFSDDPPACSVHTPLSTPLTTYPRGLLGLSRNQKKRPCPRLLVPLPSLLQFSIQMEESL